MQVDSSKLEVRNNNDPELTRFTLRPTSPPAPWPAHPQESLEPSFYSPDETPRNALLDLYKLARTPEEGLVVVGNHIGEFLASIQDELRIPGMTVVPSSARSRGRATQLGNHWVLEVPFRTRKGLAVSPFPSLPKTHHPRATHSRKPSSVSSDDEEAGSATSGTSISAPLAHSRIAVAQASNRRAPLQSHPSSSSIPQKWKCFSCQYTNSSARRTCRGCGAAQDGGPTSRRRFSRKPSRLGVSIHDDGDSLEPDSPLLPPPAAEQNAFVVPQGDVLPDSDPDLVFHQDYVPIKDEEAPIRRRHRNRARDEASRVSRPVSAKASHELDIQRALEELKVRKLTENLALADNYLNAHTWPERKHMVHAHLLAVIFQYTGELTTWQDVPSKLFHHRLRITGWPAGSLYPGTNTSVTQYKRDMLHNLCKAIWSDQLKLIPWHEDEVASQYPHLIEDTAGHKWNYEAELKGKVVLDLPSPPATSAEESLGSLAIVLTPADSTRDSDDPEDEDEGVEEGSDGSEGADETEHDSIDKEEAHVSEALSEDEDYYPVKKRRPRKSTGSDLSPAHGPSTGKARLFPTPTLRTVTERRYFSDGDMQKGKEELDERTSDFRDAATYMASTAWNVLRRMCRLHLSAYLYDHLGYTDFQDVPLRLREKRLRLLGWPVECDLPSETHPANWKRESVRALLLAIWGKTLVLQEWGKDENQEDTPLIIDDLGVYHYYNAAADALLPGKPPSRIIPPPIIPEPSTSTKRARYIPGKHYTWEPVYEPVRKPEDVILRAADLSDSDRGPTTRRQASRLLSSSPAPVQPPAPAGPSAKASGSADNPTITLRFPSVTTTINRTPAAGSGTRSEQNSATSATNAGLKRPWSRPATSGPSPKRPKTDKT